jgi:hypothetical protein
VAIDDVDKDALVLADGEALPFGFTMSDAAFLSDDRFYLADCFD